jgi:hypothetical protein
MRVSGQPSRRWYCGGPDPERHGVTYSENQMLRLLHDLGLWSQKAQPIHPEADLRAQARFKESRR